MTNQINTLDQPRANYAVLGHLCKFPNSLRSPDIKLNENDFAKDFHKIVFSAISNLSLSNRDSTSINEIDIDNYLSTYPRLYKIWEKHNGLTYIRDSIDHSNPKTFDANYQRLKKFSILRRYVENGIDVSDLIDYQSTDLKDQEEGMKRIDSMSPHEIFDHFAIKIRNMRDEMDEKEDEVKSFRAGDDLDTLLDDLNSNPEYGYPFQNKFYNTIFRGMRNQKFMLRSAGTGTGKTRQALADMTNVACDTIYDIYKDKWVSNGESYPALFISTELEKREVQTIMLAFISGVNEDVIKDGSYSEVILERLQKAIKILQRSPIYCEYVSDFSISDIEMLIEENIIDYNIKFVSFDYIQITPKLARTMSKDFGGSLREDQVLVQFSAALKTISQKYLVFLQSSTQLNRNSKDKQMRDTSSLRGGSATADKVDHGLMTFTASSEDHNELKHILERGFHEKPNYSHWVYKNRSGLKDCIIWTRMNLGNMREEPLFVTDIDFNLLDIKLTDISYDEMQVPGELPAEEVEEKEIEEISMENLEF